MFKSISHLLVAVLFLGNIPSVHAQSGINLHTADFSLSQLPSLPLSIQNYAGDPYFSQQWYLPKLGIDKAWDYTTGTATTVAVIDTGIRATHQDLAGKLWVNTNEIASNGVDDDHNGYVDDINGYNFVDKNNNISDQHGHGSGIASIILANTNNGAGIAGVNWQARVMVLKALNGTGGGNFDDVVRAIRYAADNGAKVINMSFGSPTPSEDLRSAVQYAISKNVTVVSAVGNGGASSVFYPAAYPESIAIGSIDSSDKFSTFSNYGAGVDLVAYGERILMATLTQGASGSDYSEGAGTSFSAALVTGVVSLMIARSPGLTPAQIETILKSTASGLSNNSADQKYFGSGRLNAQAAVAYQPVAVNATQNILGNSSPADGISLATVQLGLVNQFGQPQASTPVVGQISGTTNILGGQLIKGTNSISFGTTDSSGRLSFTLATTTPETKNITLYNQLTGQVIAQGISVTFIPVKSPRYTSKWLRQSPYPTVKLGSTETLWVELQNTGNTAWVSDSSTKIGMGQIRLGTDRPMDRPSSLYYATWIGTNRATSLTTNLVRPGETGRFEFTVTATQAGSTREYFRPVIDGISWLNDLGIYWDINVTSSGGVEGTNDSNVVVVNNDIKAYKASIEGYSGSLTLKPGETGKLTVTLKNQGTALWLGQGIGDRHIGSVRIGTQNPQDRASKFAAPNWLAPNRVTDSAFNVTPGSNLIFTIPIQVPVGTPPGTYSETFQLVSEFVGWFGPVFSWNLKVI